MPRDVDITARSWLLRTGMEYSRGLRLYELASKCVHEF
jgi:hypothetical protein